MKIIAFLFAFLAVASAFAPASQSSRSTTELAALFDDIANMDLFAPNKDQNKYGARQKKNLKTGTIGSSGYVPDGLTASQYNALRTKEQAKKDANYQRNVAKAGKFLDFTQFYLKRGTEEGGKWLKDAGRGHEFVKTKYDWSGKKNDAKPFF